MKERSLLKRNEPRAAASGEPARQRFTLLVWREVILL